MALAKYLEGHYTMTTDIQVPLFVTGDGKLLTREMFIKAMLSMIGVDSSSHGGHSFCIGLASSTATVRVEDHLIKTLGRWSSNYYLLLDSHTTFCSSWCTRGHVMPHIVTLQLRTVITHFNYGTFIWMWFVLYTTYTIHICALNLYRVLRALSCYTRIYKFHSFNLGVTRHLFLGLDIRCH